MLTFAASGNVWTPAPAGRVLPPDGCGGRQGFPELSQSANAMIRESSGAPPIVLRHVPGVVLARARFQTRQSARGVRRGRYACRNSGGRRKSVPSNDDTRAKMLGGQVQPRRQPIAFGTDEEHPAELPNRIGANLPASAIRPLREREFHRPIRPRTDAIRTAAEQLVVRVLGGQHRGAFSLGLGTAPQSRRSGVPAPPLCTVPNLRHSADGESLDGAGCSVSRSRSTPWTRYTAPSSPRMGGLTDDAAHQARRQATGPGGDRPCSALVRRPRTKGGRDLGAGVSKGGPPKPAGRAELLPVEFRAPFDEFRSASWPRRGRRRPS